VVAFNYLFTDPKYTLIGHDPNYYASFVIFLIVAFMVSTLTTKTPAGDQDFPSERENGIGTLSHRQRLSDGVGQG
jgi:K+-sensing histidine kinase KdpD